MEGADLEQKPGTTIHTMMEEHQFLNEFMEMMKRKIELDIKHSTALEKLKESWNPKWEYSAIWPLISPMLDYLREEIEQRQKAESEMSRFAGISGTRSPSVHSESDFNPVGFADGLESSYTRYQAAHQNITTVESRGMLDSWYNTLYDGVDIEDLTEPRLILPDIDRKYRQAVTNHQRQAEKALKWYSEGLPTALEEHQQRAEDIQSLICDSLRGLSGLAVQLSVTSAASMKATRTFISTAYIGRHHEGVKREKTHVILQPVQYHNYIANGSAALPVCGLALQDVISRIDMLLDHVTKQGQIWGIHGIHFRKAYIDTTFRLEKLLFANKCTLDPKAPPFPPESPASPFDIHPSSWPWILVYSLLNSHPILPLKRQHVDQYRKGIPRGKMHLIMDLIAPEIRKEASHLISNFFIIGYRWALPEVYDSQLGIIFTHQKGAGPIIDSIRRKWDFERDCALPQGVEQGLNGVGPLWTKTGLPYTA